MIGRLAVCVFLASVIVGCSSWPKMKYNPSNRQVDEGADPHHHHEVHHDEYEYDEQGGPSVEYGQYDRNGCSCQFYAEDTLVYQSNNVTVWHSCTGWGLHRCAQYCEKLFQDDTMRFRSRQNACDTLGREVYVGWYRRHQVCGPYGPYEDLYLNEDLCCLRGRPSDNCSRK